MEEPVWLGLKIRGKACSSLESWINNFVRFFLMEWGHGVPSLFIFNLPLKFGLKRSTLIFWVFEPWAQFSGKFTYWDWNKSREKIKWILKIWKFGMSSTRRDEQNPEIISKSKDFGFSTKFCQNSVFAKIELIFFWHSKKEMR